MRFDDEEYDVADLVLVAVGEGHWQRFEARLARGLALERDHGPEVEPGRVAEELKRFRYARGLISGKELREWLAERSLAVEDLRSHCLRNVLVDERADGGRLPPSELADVLGAEAIVSGTLRAAAARLGDLAAMAAAADTKADPPAAEVSGLVAEVAAHPAAGLGVLGDGDLERRAERILRLLWAERAFVEVVATPAGMARCFAQHGVDWLRVECSELTLASEGAAREAMLCLRLDGTLLANLSQQLGSVTHSRQHYVGDLSGSSAPLLVSAAIGDPVGPLESDEGWNVLVVNARVPPSGEDPELVRRATGVVVQRARERVKAGRVRELTAF